MSLKDVKEGKYIAKAIRGSWAKVGAKETPAVGVLFEFNCEGNTEQIWHVMYLTHTQLKDGSTVAEKTFNTLAMLGYNEERPLSKDDNGGIAFDHAHLADKQVEIVIFKETDQKDPTKVYTKVRWVNDLGGSKFAGLEAQEVLGGLDLKAQMEAARARMGAKKPTPSKMMNTDVKMPKDLPF